MINRVYKKEDPDEIYIVTDKYFCCMIDRGLEKAMRIHYISQSEAVDLEGNKYTFSDTCFIISRILNKHRQVYSGYTNSVLPQVWMKRSGLITDTNKLIIFGMAAYLLVPGTKIFIQQENEYCVIVSTMLHDTYVDVEATMAGKKMNISIV